MKDKEKALLVVSFGTTHKETCRETIEAIESHLAEALPDRRLYRAWTSGFIIKKLRERDGIRIDTVGEAFDRMAADGIKDLLVVPTHMIGGSENEKLKRAIDSWMTGTAETEEGSVSGRDTGAPEPSGFDTMKISRPLLDTDEDIGRLAEVIAGELLAGDRERTLVLMGHGSADKPEANQVYVRLEEEFHRQGYPNVFVGTVEGEPGSESFIGKINAGEVLLAPLMIVAGDHAMKDMAGEDPLSWRSRIEGSVDPDPAEADPDPAASDPKPREAGGKLGTPKRRTVTPILRGLGSYVGVQEMFLEHALKAEDRF